MKRVFLVAAVLLGTAALFFILPSTPPDPLPDPTTTEASGDPGASTDPSPIPMDPGGHSTPPDRLPAGQETLEVTVTGRGQPLAGADILVCSVDLAQQKGIQDYEEFHDDVLRSIARRAKTDGAGKVTFRELTKGQHALLARAPGFRPGGILVVVGADGAKQLNLADETLVLAGSTTDTEGKALPGVLVYAFHWLPPAEYAALGTLERFLYHWLEFEAYSDADGRFELTGLDPGNFRVVGEKEGYGDSFLSGVAAGSRDLVLVLAAGAVLEGTIRDASGKPLAGALLSTQHYFPGDRILGGLAATSDAEGRYQQTQVQAGGLAAEVIVRAKDHALLRERVTPFLAGERRVLDVQLEPAAETSGRILDPEGQPVAGAEIRYKPVNFPHYAVFELFRTQADGEFSLPYTQNDVTYNLEVQKPGFETRVFEPIAGGSEDLSLTLRPLQSLQGRLVDEAGERDFEAFEIELFIEGEHGGRTTMVRRSFPGGSGEFSFEALNPQLTGLTAWVPGYLPATTHELAALRQIIPGAELEILLQRAPRVTGRVVDSRGNPVEGTEIFLLDRSRRGRLDSQGKAAGVTGPDGRFDLGMPGHGLLLRHARLGEKWIPLDPPTSGSTWNLMDLSLGGQGSLEVQIIGSGNQPLAGIDISIRPEGVEWLGAGNTDAEGRLLIGGLAPGKILVAAHDPQSFLQQGQFFHVYREVSMETDRHHELVLALEGMGSLAGKVQWEEDFPQGDAPLAGVFARSASGQGGWGNVRSDGTYLIQGLPPDLYFISLKSFLIEDRYEVSRQAEVLPGGLTEVDFLVSSVGLAGTVRDGDSGQPLAGARLVISPEGGGAPALAYSGTDGSFGSLGLAPGSYRIEAHLDGYAAQWSGPFVVSSQSITEGAEIHLIPEALVTVLVQSLRGTGIGGARVSLRGQTRRCDESGRVTFRQLGGGAYEVVAEAAGYHPGRASTQVAPGGRETLSLALRQLVRLRVRFQGSASGQGILEDEETGQEWPAKIPLDASGPLDFDLPEGNWRIRYPGPSGTEVKTLGLFPEKDHEVVLLLQ